MTTQQITSRAGLLSFLLDPPPDMTPPQLTAFCGLLRCAKQLVEGKRKVGRLPGLAEALRQDVGPGLEQRVKRVSMELAGGRPRAQHPVSGPGLCLCGCGTETSARTLATGVVRHRLFRPGHDRRLEAMVRAVIAKKLPRSRLGVHTLRFLKGWHVFNAGELADVGVKQTRAWREVIGTTNYSWEDWYRVAGK